LYTVIPHVLSSRDSWQHVLYTSYIAHSQAVSVEPIATLLDLNPKTTALIGMNGKDTVA